MKELFHRYSSGTTTLSQLAAWLNSQGFRTRNIHNQEGEASEPRFFTVASVRGLLHNPFYTGQVKHKDQLLPGVHEAIVSVGLFQRVQTTLKRNSGRSETLNPNPAREYLLKGLIRCAHCGLTLWAQTYINGNQYYREQKGSRGGGYCLERSGSLPCHLPDDQMGRIIESIILPDAWQERMLTQIQLVDEVKRVEQGRVEVEQRLKRLGRAYVDGVYNEESYRRELKALEQKLFGLVVPEIDESNEAGKLLENLPELWQEADLRERRKLLLVMLDAVYVETVEEKAIVALKPKPAFQALFQIATTREGSGVVLYKENPPDQFSGQEDDSPCMWWRRGRVELPVQTRYSSDRAKFKIEQLYLPMNSARSHVHRRENGLG